MSMSILRINRTTIFLLEAVPIADHFPHQFTPLQKNERLDDHNDRKIR